MCSQKNRINLSDNTLFPALYQAHHADYLEDISFWLDLARMYGSPILELGCGTGRVLKPLATAGFTCFGLDNDLHMLILLRKNNLSEEIARTTLTGADMINLPFQYAFPLIILTCNTYSTLPGTQRNLLLNSVFRNLSKDGIFTVSVPNPDILNNLETTDESEYEKSFIHPGTNLPVQVSCKIVRNLDYLTFHWYYDHLFPDGNVERFEFPVRQYLITKNQYLAEFQSAGFEVKDIYGDFDYSPHRHNSPNMIIIAQKNDKMKTPC